MEVLPNLLTSIRKPNHSLALSASPSCKSNALAWLATSVAAFGRRSVVRFALSLPPPSPLIECNFFSQGRDTLCDLHHVGLPVCFRIFRDLNLTPFRYPRLSRPPTSAANSGCDLQSPGQGDRPQAVRFTAQAFTLVDI